MDHTRFKCNIGGCGFQDKAFDGEGLIVAIQVHLSARHQMWPLPWEIEQNPKKWGVEFVKEGDTNA
jgi:hypothetical protein